MTLLCLTLLLINFLFLLVFLGILAFRHEIFTLLDRRLSHCVHVRLSLALEHDQLFNLRNQVLLDICQNIKRVSVARVSDVELAVSWNDGDHLLAQFVQDLILVDQLDLLFVLVVVVLLLFNHETQNVALLQLFELLLGGAFLLVEFVKVFLKHG